MRALAFAVRSLPTPRSSLTVVHRRPLATPLPVFLRARRAMSTDEVAAAQAAAALAAGGDTCAFYSRPGPTPPELLDLCDPQLAVLAGGLWLTVCTPLSL